MIERDAFLKTALPERVIDIPGKGEVRIRGLSRGEAKHMAAMADTDKDAVDGWMVAKCLLDPVLTVEEATAWLDSAPVDEAAAVILPMLELSGLVEGADKKAYAQFRGDGSGGRVRPGGEAGPDSEGTAGVDQ